MIGWETRRLQVRRIQQRERLGVPEPERAEIDQRALMYAREALQQADALVRGALEELNHTLLGGRGSIGEAQPVTTRDAYLWEFWWEPQYGRTKYLVVTLLRDSRGTPYLKVEGRRLALSDTLVQQRLRRALQASLAQPRLHDPEEASLMRALDTLLRQRPGDRRHIP